MPQRLAVLEVEVERAVALRVLQQLVTRLTGERLEVAHAPRIGGHDVQHLAGHADPRTTRLYDRRQKQVTRNMVERISI